MQKLFPNKVLQKLYKKIYTDGEVMLKIKVASFFLGHCVYFFKKTASTFFNVV